MRRLQRVAAHFPAVAALAAENKIKANAVPRYSDQGPLAGVVVLDLTQMVSGPMGTQLLGDQGANVIKIENTTSGAAERGGSRSTISSPLNAQINRNKRSLSVDLKSIKGVAVLRRLVATADVLVQNFRPGVMDRMGIGYVALQEINPGLIFVLSIGSSAPHAGELSGCTQRVRIVIRGVALRLN